MPKALRTGWFSNARATSWSTAKSCFLACQLWIAVFLGGLPFLLTVLPAHAENITTGAPAAENLLKPGDIAASGFAGVKLQGEGLRPGVDPLTKTVIDPAGITLRIYDGSRAAAPLAGQQLALPPRKEFKAEEIGHVFGLVFDQLPADERGTPGLYAAATSAFGLYVVGPDGDGDGQPDRLMRGAPGARFMDGLFGKAPGGGAGAIWKIDSVTGAASLYAELTSGGLTNSGAGIGGLAFDPVSRSLYASDLDTGVIHQLKGASVGEDVGQFDHGMQGEPQAGREGVADDGRRLDIASPDFDTTNPATWGFTQSARRIDAMAVHGRRLYYAVAKGPEIWSVGLADDGSFLQDARIEVGVDEPGTIATIAFDSQGSMILALRGAIQNAGDYSAFVANGPADVIRYAPQNPQTASAWQPDTLTYPVGQSQERRDGSGGLALQYAYRQDGSVDLASCSGTLVVSGDVLNPQRTIHGLQIGEASRFQKAAGADIPTAFVALDPPQDDAEARGHAGGVAVLSQCGGPGGFPPVSSEGAQFPGIASGDSQPGFPGVENRGAGQTGFPGVDNGGGGGQTTFPPVEGGGGQAGKLTLAKTAAVPKCSPDGGCAFNIEVTNNGPEVPGPITINEQIEAPGAVLMGEPDAPWQCSKAAPFVCTHPGPVPANGKLDMRLVFAPHTAPEVKELKNCASVADAAAKPADDRQKAQIVAPVALPPPTASNAGGLAVQASGVPAQCSPKAGTCEFEVEVTNTSPNPVTGPFRVIQTLAVGTQTQAKNSPQSISLPAGLQCQPDGRELDCQQPELTLAPGESRTMRVAFSIDTTEGGAADFVQSKAAVTFGPLAGEATAAIAFDEPLNNKLPEPGAQQAGQNPPDAPQAGQDQPQAPVCATIALDPNAPVQTGPVIISKKGTASCPLVGPCTFEITLTNTTDVAVPGPIPFTDMPDVAGARLSDAPIPEPFSCAKGGPPFNCTLGNAAQGLGPHESKTLPLTLDLDLPDGTTSLKNCAVRPAAPAAPQKKALLLTPSGRNPLMSYASFRPETFAKGGLLHLVDDAGGNIGGVNSVKKDCTQWGVKNGGFVIRQSNGLEIRFSKMSVDANGTVTAGQADYFPKDGGANIPGTVTGTLSGNKFILDVKWKVASGDTGHYEGTIGADGKVSGSHVNKAGVRDTFVNQGDWWICKSSKFCEDYASGVSNAELAMAFAGCTPKDTQGLWAPDRQKHIDFCMSRASTAAPELEAKNKARADEMAKCSADNKAKIDAQCDAFAKNVIAANAEMKALNCAKLLPWTTLDEAKSVCLSNSPRDRDGNAQGVQKTLDACKAQAAANGNAGGGGGGAGGAAQTGGQPQEPAPEQCVMVAIKDIAPPGGGGKTVPPAKPGQEQPQASNAGPLSLVKTFSNEACVDNRCKFNITIANTSDAAFQGPIDFTDEETDGVFNKGTVSTESNPKFVCQEQNGRFLCSNAAVTLAAKSSISITLTVGLGEGVIAAKEIKNCAKLDGAPTPSCATAPLQAPAPPAPAQPKNLALANNPGVAQCSDTGGGCAFVTSLSNPADAPAFDGPVSFTAHLSQPDGSAFPNITMEDGGHALPLDGVTPSIFCKKDGNDVTCTATALKIPPGESVQIPMTFKPGGGTTATALKSCASFAGGEKQCATIPLVRGPLLRAQKFTAAQTCVPSCSFAISLKNVGTDAAPGPFVIEEDFRPLNADTSIDTIDGDFQCFRSAKPSLACISSKDRLEPGQSLSGRVLIKTGTVSPNYSNCIDYNPAANGKPSPFDKEFAGRCVTIKDTLHQGVNKMVEVIAPNAGANGIGECAINSPCRFRVKLTSNGARNDTNVAFSTRLQNGVAEAIGDGPGMAVAGWNCNFSFAADHNQGACGSTTVDKLPPQTSVEAEVGVIAGATWKKNDTLTLCAVISDDSNLNDNNACASVKLDPFNVKVTKTGDQSCTLGGDCNFTIRLFNPGPIDHNAPVTISDKLTGLASAQIVSTTPPLPCAAQPTQIPFSCTSPGPVRLDLDAPEGSPFGPRNFKMVVRLPSDASSKQFSNCADASDGTGAPGAQSCVTVAALPPVSTCQAGMVPTSGICACPPGTKWSGKTCNGEGSGGASMSKPIAPDVGSGGASASNPIALEPSPLLRASPATCKFGMALASNGLCACPTNSRWTGKACEAGPGGGGFNASMQPAPSAGTGGASMSRQPPVEQAKACPAGRPIGTYPNCCPQGTEYRNGKCRYTQAPPVEVKCGGGLVKDARTGKCVACQRGTHAQGKVCVPDRVKQQKQTPVCPADRPVGAYPNCCPQGTEYRNGKCRFTKPAKITCHRGQVFDPATGACIDRAPVEERACPTDRPIGTYPNCCPDGYEFMRGACRRFREQRQEQQQYCPSDRPNGTYPNCCPNGYEFRGHRCRKAFDQQQGGANPPPTQQHDCPPGYRTLSKPNKYGAYCEQIPVDQPAPPPPPPPQCTGGKVAASTGGCVCPGGMTENGDGQCTDSVK
ncbi:hypothetical protein EOD23_01680 [Mesorhizobium sp. USDA-HM6]|nr:hypothetical protein EOD23_01680 [Mesorhizobium sp. USDA-HM6]